MRPTKPLAVLAVIAFALLPAPVHAATICTIVADADTRNVLLAEGDCETRVTPASTFKVPLAVMAFDAGIIASPTEPKYPFKEGYSDWVADWRQDTDPTMWMHYSNVWYSQRLTEQLGAAKLTAYAQAFNLGNADFSGDAGRDNGLMRAWISSSLKVSPLEQAGFVAALVNRQLPVSAHAMDGALSLVESPGEADGWRVWGKTGSAYPRNADYTLNYARGWGWYVGWAEKEGRRVVFARLNQDDRRHDVSGGLRARDEVMGQWGDIAARAGL
ncbi:beta-lactamase class D [Devosia lucknowensis]|uniref:beta-lactamase n=1 Tax=Devosia lucknowensis TaxID=1096929 RepID=A0A1Y6G516_9HYPH|nr:class D beta-lactamase [Devosia lucknowensis]SMQ85265.1 beta-lactamase class D [Devosia lucknowensis]